MQEEEQDINSTKEYSSNDEIFNNVENQDNTGSFSSVTVQDNKTHISTKSQINIDNNTNIEDLNFNDSINVKNKFRVATTITDQKGNNNAKEKKGDGYETLSKNEESNINVEQNRPDRNLDEKISARINIGKRNQFNEENGKHSDSLSEKIDDNNESEDNNYPLNSLKEDSILQQRDNRRTHIENSKKENTSAFSPENIRKKRNQAINWINSFGRPVNEPDEKTKEDEPSSNNIDKKNDSNENNHDLNNNSPKENSNINYKKNNDEEKDFTAKADKLISHMAKYWKFYLIGGGIILLILFLVILTTIVSVGEEVLSSTKDYSSGYISRTNPESSYKCVETPASSLNDINLLAPTPLTKTEFVEKVKAYTPSGNEKCSKAQVKRAYDNLVSHAEEIYDVGVRIGINPEIIFLRADAEGYTPSCIDSLSSYYNYYGMGCYNGDELHKCTKFSSVSQGVYDESQSSSFFMWILKYIKDTQGMYSDTFRAYAWLNTYWVLDDGPTFPSGNGDVQCKNWGLGACCYSRIVEKRLILLGYPERANEIKEICEGSKRNAPLEDKKAHIYMGSFPYLETWYDPRNKDQRAYVFWQTDNIITIRKKIFGLGSDTDGSNPNPNCPDKIITDDISKVIDNENLIKLENKPYGTLLLENGSSIDEINKQLLAKIKESGLGTRKAVVNAAKFQLNAFAAYGMKITYMYQGGHRDFYDKSGKQIAKNTDYFYGINPYYGIEVSTPTSFENSDNKYYYLGLDCSGSANWALHNGGLNVPRLSSQEYVNNASSYNITLSDVHDFSKPAQPGDLIVKYGTYPDKDGKPQLEHHTALIAEVNYSSDDPYFIIIEEVGGGYIARKRSLKTDSSDASYLKKFHVAHLDYYYNNSPKFDNFEQTFNDGLIKWEG